MARVKLETPDGKKDGTESTSAMPEQSGEMVSPSSDNTTPQSSVEGYSASTEGVVLSSDPAIVDPTASGSSTEFGDAFDTTSGGTQRTDIWTLATEKALRQVAEMETREKGVQEEVDRFLKSLRVELLEGMSSDGKQKTASAEREEGAWISLLQNQLQEEKLGVLQRELMDANRLNELVKAEWKKKLQVATEKLAVSEKRARDVRMESNDCSERIEVLERALQSEWSKARDQERDFQSQLTAARAQFEESSSIVLRAGMENTRLTRELAEAKQQKTKLGGEYDKAMRLVLQLEERLTKLGDEQTSLTDKNLQLSAKGARLARELAEVKSEKRELVQRNDSAETQIVQLEENLRELEDERADIVAKSLRLGIKNVGLTRELAEIKTDKEALASEHGKAERQRVQLEKKVKELKSEPIPLWLFYCLVVAAFFVGLSCRLEPPKQGSKVGFSN